MSRQLYTSSVAFTASSISPFRLRRVALNFNASIIHNNYDHEKTTKNCRFRIGCGDGTPGGFFRSVLITPTPVLTCWIVINLRRVVALGTQVIVHHIQHNSDAFLIAGIANRA